MLQIEIRAAEGGDDSKSLVELLAQVYQKRCDALG